MSKKSIDIKNGLKAEKKVIKKLRKKYEDIEAVEDKYSPIDFISKRHKIVFELKSTEQECLKSYRFGYDKYKYYRKQFKGFKFMLVYCINGSIVYCVIKNPKKKHRIIEWGRTDRGVNEIVKKYVVVNRECFKVFKYQYKDFEILPLNHYALNNFHIEWD